MPGTVVCGLMYVNFKYIVLFKSLTEYSHQPFRKVLLLLPYRLTGFKEVLDSKLSDLSKVTHLEHIPSLPVGR